MAIREKNSPIQVGTGVERKRKKWENKRDRRFP